VRARQLFARTCSAGNVPETPMGDDDRTTIDQLLTQPPAPTGVVFEVAQSQESALRWAIPEIKKHADTLRAAFPNIKLAVVTHGKEEFALLSENTEKYSAVVDPGAFQEILSNLLSNAVKYCDQGNEIKVILEHADGRLALKVEDTGPGMSEQDCKRIFQRFQRGSNPKTEGQGYGLAIVKTLAELHGGYAEVSSVLDKGTTFSVVLAEKE